MKVTTAGSKKLPALDALPSSSCASIPRAGDVAPAQLRQTPARLLIPAADNQLPRVFRVRAPQAASPSSPAGQGHRRSRDAPWYPPGAEGMQEPPAPHARHHAAVLKHWNTHRRDPPAPQHPMQQFPGAETGACWCYPPSPCQPRRQVTSGCWRRLSERGSHQHMLHAGLQGVSASFPFPLLLK